MNTENTTITYDDSKKSLFEFWNDKIKLTEEKLVSKENELRETRKNFEAKLENKDNELKETKKEKEQLEDKVRQMQDNSSCSKCRVF